MAAIAVGDAQGVIGLAGHDENDGFHYAIANAQCNYIVADGIAEFFLRGLGRHQDGFLPGTRVIGSGSSISQPLLAKRPSWRHRRETSVRALHSWRPWATPRLQPLLRGIPRKHFGSAGAVRDHASNRGFFPGPVAEDAFEIIIFRGVADNVVTRFDVPAMIERTSITLCHRRLARSRAV